MFGNLLGWIIAGVIAAAFGAGVFFMAGLIGRTEATAWAREKQNTEKIQFKTPASQVFAMEQDGDAGDLYREAIADYQDNTTLYESAMQEGDVGKLKSLPGVQKLLAARAMRTATIFAKDPKASIQIQEFRPPNLDALLKVSDATALCASRLALTDQKAATDYANAVFSLGYKLFEERVRFMEAESGIGQMGTALAVLKSMAMEKNDTILADRFGKFDDERREVYEKRLVPMWKVIVSPDTRQTSVHAGDMFYFAGPEQKEKMWRVESILKMGRMRFNLEGKADQIALDPELTRLSKDKDPVIAAAAQQAIDLTVEGYRSIRFMDVQQ